MSKNFKQRERNLHNQTSKQTGEEVEEGKKEEQTSQPHRDLFLTTGRGQLTPTLLHLQLTDLHNSTHKDLVRKNCNSNRDYHRYQLQTDGEQQAGSQCGQRGPGHFEGSTVSHTLCSWEVHHTTCPNMLRRPGVTWSKGYFPAKTFQDFISGLMTCQVFAGYTGYG